MKLFQTIIGLTILLVILNNTSIFQTGSAVFSSRLESATAIEASEGGGVSEGIYKRMILGSLQPIITLFDNPMFAGYLGMGTNAGAMLLSGKTIYLIGESEPSRLIGESGVIIGITLLGLRLVLSLSLFFKSFALTKKNEILPWLFYSIVGAAFIQGQLGQPTQLGFLVLVGGFLLASLKDNNEVNSIEG